MIDLVSFTIDKDNFNHFIGSFGKDLADIAIDADVGSISAAVGKSTHYIYRKIDCGVEKGGKVYITDIPKLKSFLSNVKSKDLEINQEGKTGTLHVRCGKSSLQLPTSSHIESQKRVSIMQKAIEQSKQSMWRMWFNSPLTHHATLNSLELKPATGFKKVLGDKYSCKTEFDSDGSEFIVRGGKSATGKMFVRATLTQLEAPATSARSAFDKWLPDLLSNIPNGDVEIHTANESVLIVVQPSTDFIMIVIDQEYEED